MAPFLLGDFELEPTVAPSPFVIPAKAGTQRMRRLIPHRVPAYAGMTRVGDGAPHVTILSTAPLPFHPAPRHSCRMTAFAYIGAALAEIAGCFAFWAWLRLGKSIWWIAPGMAALALFAYLLTLVDAEHAGRTYAAYGGVYIVSALLWLWAVEGAKPDRWDLIGAAVCLGGAAVILFGPRGS